MNGDRVQADEFTIYAPTDGFKLECPDCGWTADHSHGPLRDLLAEAEAHLTAVHRPVWRNEDTIARLAAAKPSHLHADPGDKYALCGEQYPSMWAAWVGNWRRHRAEKGWPELRLCPDCERLALERGVPLDGAQEILDKRGLR